MSRLYKFPLTLAIAAVLFLAAGCGDATPACPTTTGTPEFLTVSPQSLPIPTPASGVVMVEMGGRAMQVDKLVEGPLCNDTWSGTVYVGCDVQVYPWQGENPTFLKNCQLSIDPQTIVYVAAHNNAAYYNGCSCHTGVTPEP